MEESLIQRDQRRLEIPAWALGIRSKASLKIPAWSLDPRSFDHPPDFEAQSEVSDLAEASKNEIPIPIFKWY